MVYFTMFVQPDSIDDSFPVDMLRYGRLCPLDEDAMDALSGFERNCLDPVKIGGSAAGKAQAEDDVRRYSERFRSFGWTTVTAYVGEKEIKL